MNVWLLIYSNNNGSLERITLLWHLCVLDTKYIRGKEEGYTWYPILY